MLRWSRWFDMTTDETPTSDGGSDATDSELVVRLRQRAEELRASAPERMNDPEDTVPEPEPEPDAEPGPETATEAEHQDADPPAEIDDHDDHDDHDDSFSGAAHGAFDDPAESELLRRWADEDHIEAVSPRRNWTPLVVLVVLVALVALIAVAFRAVGGDDAETTGDGQRGGEAEASSVLDEDIPSLEDLTADVTIPPGPAEGLSIADKGVAIVEDRFDPARREGTFAVVIENPHLDWLAQSVQVEVEFLDEQGVAVGGDTAFVEVVLPGQTVAVANHFFDAPAVPITDLAVTIDVARWRESEPFEGGFTTTDVVTEEAEFSGLRTTFVLRSTFDRPLTDVGVTVVYKGQYGQIVGGYDTFIDLVEPGVDVPVEIALLANLPVEQIISTDLYPSTGFGFIPDE